MKAVRFSQRALWTGFRKCRWLFSFWEGIPNGALVIDHGPFDSHTRQPGLRLPSFRNIMQWVRLIVFVHAKIRQTPLTLNNFIKMTINSNQSRSCWMQQIHLDFLKPQSPQSPQSKGAKERQDLGATLRPDKDRNSLRSSRYIRFKVNCLRSLEQSVGFFDPDWIFHSLRLTRLRRFGMIIGHKPLALMVGAGSMVPGACSLVLGTWCLIIGAWYLVLGTRCLIIGAWYLVLDHWCLVLGAWY